MASQMIFWTKKVEPFKAANGMLVTPNACTYLGEEGFFLGLNWASEIVEKGAEITIVLKENIQLHG